MATSGPIRTQALVFGKAPDTAPHMLITAAAAEVLLFKTVSLWNGSGTNVRCVFWVQPQAGDVTVNIIDLVLNTGSSVEQSVYVAINPGQQLWGQFNVPLVHYWVTGVVLPGEIA